MACIPRHDRKPVLQRRGGQQQICALVADPCGKLAPAPGHRQIDPEDMIPVYLDNTVQSFTEPESEFRIGLPLPRNASFDLADGNDADI